MLNVNLKPGARDLSWWERLKRRHLVRMMPSPNANYPLKMALCSIADILGCPRERGGRVWQVYKTMKYCSAYRDKWAAHGLRLRGLVLDDTVKLREESRRAS